MLTPEKATIAGRLIYAATARCPCGAGLAYDPETDDAASPFKGPSFWDCSEIILGIASSTMQHTAQLPFAFYDVEAEGVTSARGYTTRPSYAPKNEFTHSMQTVNCTVCAKRSQEVLGQYLRAGLEADGWKTALGHDDVWVCPKCIGDIFQKAYSKEADHAD